MSYLVIKGSEIAEYVYCGRAWWLRVYAGYEPLAAGRLTSGTLYHERHGANVARSERARSIALGLLFVAVSVFFFWLIRAT